MNVFTFTGRIGNDAEVRQAGSSTVCGFSVAVESGYGDKKKTNWIKCSLWGKRAEGGLPQYLVKGAQVAVSGEASLEEWEGNNGKGSNIAVNVNDITLVGSKQDGGQQGQAPQQQAPSHGGKSASDYDDGSIPF